MPTLLDETSFQSRMGIFFFFILGVGSLLPWNVLVTSANYYKSRFCGSEYYDLFESTFSTCFLAFQSVSTLYVSLKPQFLNNLTRSILHTMFAYMGIFALQALLVVLKAPQNLLFTMFIINY